LTFFGESYNSAVRPQNNGGKHSFSVTKWPEASNLRARTILGVIAAKRWLMGEALSLRRIFRVKNSEIAEMADVRRGDVEEYLHSEPQSLVDRSAEIPDVPWLDIIEAGRGPAIDDDVWIVIACGGLRQLIDEFDGLDAAALPVPPNISEGGVDHCVLSDQERRFCRFAYSGQEFDRETRPPTEAFLRRHRLFLICNEGLVRKFSELDHECTFCVPDGPLAWQKAVAVVWFQRQRYGVGWLPSLMALGQSLVPNLRDRKVWSASVVEREAASPDEIHRFGDYMAKTARWVAAETSRSIEFGWLPCSVDSRRIYVLRNSAVGQHQPVPPWIPVKDLVGQHEELMNSVFASAHGNDRCVLVFDNRCKGIRVRWLYCGLPAHAVGLFRRLFPEVSCDVVGIVPASRGDAAWLGRLLHLASLLPPPAPPEGNAFFSAKSTNAQALLSVAIDAMKKKKGLRDTDGCAQQRLALLDQAINEERDLSEVELQYFGVLGQEVSNVRHDRRLVRSVLGDKALDFALNHHRGGREPLRDRWIRILAGSFGLNQLGMAVWLKRFAGADDLEQREILPVWQTWIGKRVAGIFNVSESDAGSFKIMKDVATTIVRIFRGTAGLEDRHRKMAAKQMRITVVTILDEPWKQENSQAEFFHGLSAAQQDASGALDLISLLESARGDFATRESWIGGKLDALARNQGGDAHVRIGALAAALEVDRPEEVQRQLLLQETPIGLLVRMIASSTELSAEAHRLLRKLRRSITGSKEFLACNASSRHAVERWLRIDGTVLEAALAAAANLRTTRLHLDWQRIAVTRHPERRNG
jgi:hypothetical protein